MPWHFICVVEEDNCEALLNLRKRVELFVHQLRSSCPNQSKNFSRSLTVLEMMFIVLGHARETYYTIAVIPRDEAFEPNNAIPRFLAKCIKVISGHTQNRNSF